MPTRDFLISAPTGGYRASSFGLQNFGRMSRNMSVHADTPEERPGFAIRRQISSAAASFLQRLPVDQADGTLRAAFQHGGTIYEDGASPTARDATVQDPYGAATRRLPQWVWALGKLWWCNGTDWRTMLYTGGALKVKGPLTDPGNPTLAAAAGGAMTARTWYARIRWYDSDTATESGPNARTGAAGTVAVSGGNLGIKVTRGTPPARATHWQVEFAAVDSPTSYQIHYTAKDAVGGATISGATGRIPIASADAYFDSDPTSGVAFESRDGVYRHANPPTGAAFVVQYAGRLFYASPTDTWLVWTETDNLEHAYFDPTDPHTGLSSVDGEGLVDTVVSPCTALAATETQIFFFMQSGIVVGSGTFELIDGNRQAHFDIMTQNTLGASSPCVLVVDQDIFFVSEAGPQVFSGGGVLDLDTRAIREDWLARNVAYDNRITLGYDPQRKLVLVSYVSSATFAAGMPDRVLAWSVEMRQWCPPWELAATSFTLHRFTTDAGAIRGVRLFFGGPYGAMNEFGFGNSDGGLSSDTDTHSGLIASSSTTTTVTVSGKTWTTDQHKSRSLILVDRTTGAWHTKWIKSNTATQITWEGTVSHSGGGWAVYIGGISAWWHVPVTSNAEELVLQRCAAINRDLFAAKGV